MTSAEIVKQASKVVAGLIKDKTPPLFETCKAAFNELGELVRYAGKADEEITTEFAQGIDSVIKRLDALRATVVKGAPAKKEMDETAFATYVKEQIEKAVKEDAAPALRRLHALKSVLGKASWDGTTVVAVEYYTDPFQQATLEIEEGSRTVSSGNAGVDEVSVPGITLDAIMKSVVNTVETAARDSFDMNTGWARDLASKEFLRGERNVDFGPDSK
jgi:hypothetical protein